MVTVHPTRLSGLKKPEGMQEDFSVSLTSRSPYYKLEIKRKKKKEKEKEKLS